MKKEGKKPRGIGKVEMKEGVSGGEGGQDAIIGQSQQQASQSSARAQTESPVRTKEAPISICVSVGLCVVVIMGGRGRVDDEV